MAGLYSRAILARSPVFIMEKSLDQKLARILADPSCDEFILADAKDADMAFGLAAPGQGPGQQGTKHYRTLPEYRDLIRQNVEQGLIDIMLMSVSTNELLTIDERLFDHSHVTPAVRANDTSDVHLPAGGVYPQHPSRPFRTALIDHAMCGHLGCTWDERSRGADLGLYSVTFNNDLDHDLRALDEYRQFRIEAEQKGFRHFLEVFDPNACGSACPSDMARYINDTIVRSLAGVARAGRPIFLKIVYHGPEAMEQLASYDPSLIPGILGGSSGTTLDAYHMLWEAKKHGAKVALYGRKINNAEHQPSFIQHLRNVADGNEKPEEAVRAYHGDLQGLNIKPYRKLEDDLQRTDTASSYSERSEPGRPGPGSSVRPVPVKSGPEEPGPRRPGSLNARDPDFTKMSPREKVEWNLRRLSSL